MKYFFTNLTIPTLHSARAKATCKACSRVQKVHVTSACTNSVFQSAYNIHTSPHHFKILSPTHVTYIYKYESANSHARLPQVPGKTPSPTEQY